MPAYATERLKRIDAVLSPLACAGGRAISAATRRTRQRDERMLVLRPGGMGDLIAAQIATEELGWDPRAVLWLIERRSASWAGLQELPFVAYDDGVPATLRAVAGRHRVVINTEQYFGLAQAVASAAVGTDGLTAALATSRAARWADRTVGYDPFNTHETVAFRRLFAAALGVQTDGAPRPRGRTMPDTGELLVAVSGQQSPTRALTTDRWAEQIDAWAEGRPVTIAAAPLDRAFADELAFTTHAHATRLDTGFAELCARIAGAHELLTMDGGPVHIASYYGTPTRALFTSGRDRKWAPLAEGSTIVRTWNLSCQPCTLFGQTPPCPHALACHVIDPVRDVRPASPGPG